MILSKRPAKSPWTCSLAADAKKRYFNRNLGGSYVGYIDSAPEGLVKGSWRVTGISLLCYRMATPAW